MQRKSTIPASMPIASPALKHCRGEDLETLHGRDDVPKNLLLSDALIIVLLML